MLLSNQVGAVVEGRRLSTFVRRFLDELLHPLENLLGIVFWFYDCFAPIFVNFYLGAGPDTKTLSYLLWENDSTLRIDGDYLPTSCGNCFDVLVRRRSVFQVGPVGDGRERRRICRFVDSHAR